MLRTTDKRNVRITGGIFRERMDLDKAYLMELDTQCLLQNFYIEAGIIMPGLQIVPDPNSANLHWGWESPTCQLRGHFLGHWMSAAAAFVASDNDVQLKAKLDRIVSELARCQELNGGEWVGSIPEKYLDRLARPEYIWSPQYTMHKTVMGLVDTYRFTGNEQALCIADKLADWYIKWIERMSKTDPDIAYKGEQGGMLEEWAELYHITKDKKYLSLIESYKNSYLFKELGEGRDALTDNHANASIPVSHGSARLYEVLPDEKARAYYRDMTEKFWANAVEDREMYATTGANAGEFWIPKHKMAQYIGDTDQEFCTVYNMVRTADYLYRWSGDTRYLDYIELALYNGFLAQQNGVTGMPTYFLPMRAGARKKWGTKRNDFWCCYGTMVQAQSLYPSLVYYADEEKGCINAAQYIPCEASFDWSGNHITISQTTDMVSYNNQVFFDEHSGGEKTRWSIRFEINAEKAFDFRLRIPTWSAGKPIISQNGTRLSYEERDGYALIPLSGGTSVVSLVIPSKVRAKPLDDEPTLAALVDGPIVLAGLVDKDCGIVYEDDAANVLCQRTEHTYSTYVWRQNCYITAGQPVNFEFKPLYDITDEAYTLYFTLKKK